MDWRRPEDDVTDGSRAECPSEDAVRRRDRNPPPEDAQAESVAGCDRDGERKRKDAEHVDDRRPPGRAAWIVDAIG